MTIRKSASLPPYKTTYSNLNIELVSEIRVNVPRMIEVREFKELRYPGVKPTVRTLKNWIQQGLLAGEMRGGMYFVDVSRELMSTGDPLIDQMLG